MSLPNYEKKYFFNLYCIYLDKNTSGAYFSSFFNNKAGYQTSCSFTYNFFAIYWTRCIFYIWKNWCISVRFLWLKKRDNRNFFKHHPDINSSLASFINLFAYEFFNRTLEEINMNSNNDYVVLVDRQNKVLGTAPKLATHNANTPLHRAFSLFLFNSKGELLLQQRGSKKKTWPLVWSNSVCGHPMLNESNKDAVTRRLEFELGIELEKIYEILPNFSYRAEMNGIVENELCPVFVAFADGKPIPNTDEIENIRWIKWQDFMKEIKEKPGTYSVWFEEEAKLLENNKDFLKLYNQFITTEA